MGSHIYNGLSYICIMARQVLSSCQVILFVIWNVRSSGVIRSCLVCVTILPQLCHDPASVVSRSCLSCVTIVPRL